MFLIKQRYYKPNELEDLINQAFRIVSSYMFTHANQGEKYDSFGDTDKSSQHMNRLNDYIMLIGLLSVIRRDVWRSLAVKCDTPIDLKSFFDKYKLECLIDGLQCRKVRYKELFDLFDLEWLLNKDFEATGIGYMALESGCPVFIVK